MRITEGKLRQSIREEAKRVLRENAAMSVEEVYSILRDMAPGPDMPIVQVAAEIGMPVQQLEAMLKSDEFNEHMDSMDYSMPIGYDESARVVFFNDPMSN